MSPSLLFIPDISGFTRFVTETEAEHGRHVVAELLEVLIASDELGMTVAEIEGDAVLFFLPDRVPSLNEIAAQAARTFRAFHAHLQRFERDRICECGACTGVHGLSLKFVAHAGPIETLRVREFAKPFGPDVIVAHRLLKNDVPDDEYLLVTESWLDEEGELPEWARLARGATEYEDVGRICHGHVALGRLKDDLPEPEPRATPMRSNRPARVSTVVPLDMDSAFELVANFDHRLSWNDGVDTFDYEPGRVNRVGTPHRCVIGGDVIEFETTTSDFGPGKRVYGERILSSTPVVDPVVYYILERDTAGTRVTAEVHWSTRGLLGPLKGWAFRRGMTTAMGRALDALRVASTRFPQPTAAAASPR